MQVQQNKEKSQCPFHSVWAGFAGEELMNKPRRSRASDCWKVRFSTFRQNCRSRHYAPPDFLWRLVALMNSMRLSLWRAARVVVASSAK
jgi:hypothetical protein